MDQIIRIFAFSSSNNSNDPNLLFERIFEIINFELQLSLIKSTSDKVISGQLSLIEFDIETGFKLEWISFFNQILRSSMRQFHTLVYNGQRLLKKQKIAAEYSESDLNLILESLSIIKLAFELAEQKQQNTTDREFEKKYGRLPSLLDHSQLVLIKQWFTKENFISELIFNLYSSPLYSPIDIIYVQDIEYFKQLINLLNTTPKHVIYNYMGWTVISRYRNFVGGRVRETFTQFEQIFDFEPRSTIINFTKPFEFEPLWKHCINRVINVFPWNASHRYVKRFVPKRVKHDVTKMVKMAKYSFEELIRYSDWLDDVTREMAMEKLDSMQQFVAYPEWLLIDYEFYTKKKNKNGDDRKFSIIINNKSNKFKRKKESKYFQMAIEKLCFNRIWQLLVLKFTSINDFNGWPDAPIKVEAYYSPSTNSIGNIYTYLC